MLFVGHSGRRGQTRYIFWIPRLLPDRAPATCTGPLPYFRVVVSACRPLEAHQRVAFSWRGRPPWRRRPNRRRPNRRQRRRAMHGGPWACSKRMLCCSAFVVLVTSVCVGLSTACTTHGCTRRGVLLELGGQTAGRYVCSASSTVMTPSVSSHVLQHGTVAVTEAVGLGQNASACTLHGGQTCASV